MLVTDWWSGHCPGSAGPACPSMSSWGPPSSPPESPSVAGNKPPPNAAACSHRQPPCPRWSGSALHEATTQSSATRHPPGNTGRVGACFLASGPPQARPLCSWSPEPHSPDLKPSSSIANCGEEKIERGKENQFAQRDEVSPPGPLPFAEPAGGLQSRPWATISDSRGWGPPPSAPMAAFASRSRVSRSPTPGGAFCLVPGLLGLPRRPWRWLCCVCPRGTRETHLLVGCWDRGLGPHHLLSWTGLRPLPSSGQRESPPRDMCPLPSSPVIPGATRSCLREDLGTLRCEPGATHTAPTPPTPALGV